MKRLWSSPFFVAYCIQEYPLIVRSSWLNPLKSFQKLRAPTLIKMKVLKEFHVLKPPRKLAMGVFWFNIAVETAKLHIGKPIRKIANLHS